MEVFKDQFQFQHKYNENPEERVFLEVFDNLIVSAQDYGVYDRINPLKLIAWTNQKIDRSEYETSHEFRQQYTKEFLQYSFWKGIPKKISYDGNRFSPVAVLYQNSIVDCFDNPITDQHLSKEVLFSMRKKGVMTQLYNVREMLAGTFNIDFCPHVLNYQFLIARGYKVEDIIIEDNRDRAFEILNERKEDYDQFLECHKEVNIQNFNEYQNIVQLPFAFKMALDK